MENSPDGAGGRAQMSRLFAAVLRPTELARIARSAGEKQQEDG